MRRSRAPVLVLVIAVWLGPLGTAAAQSVDAIVSRALTEHPELAAARAEVDAARARLQQAGLRPNPMLDLAGQQNVAGPRQQRLGGGDGSARSERPEGRSHGGGGAGGRAQGRAPRRAGAPAPGRDPTQGGRGAGRDAEPRRHARAARREPAGSRTHGGARAPPGRAPPWEGSPGARGGESPRRGPSASWEPGRMLRLQLKALAASARGADRRRRCARGPGGAG
jgi:hypothetical protein